MSTVAYETKFGSLERFEKGQVQAIGARGLGRSKELDTRRH